MYAFTRIHQVEGKKVAEWQYRLCALRHPVERCQCYSTSTAGFHVKWDSQFFFFFFLALSCAILVGSSMRAQRGEKSYLIVNSFWAPMHNVVKCMKKSHLYACTLWFDVLVAFPMLFVHFVLEFLGRLCLCFTCLPHGENPQRKSDPLDMNDGKKHSYMGKFYYPPFPSLLKAA